jgi:hypothetical protein
MPQKIRSIGHLAVGSCMSVSTAKALLEACQITPRMFINDIEHYDEADLVPFFKVAASYVKDLPEPASENVDS